MTTTRRSLSLLLVSLAGALAGAILSTSATGDGTMAAAPLDRAPQQQQNEFSLALSNPASHPRLGLPDVLVTGADADLSAAAKTLADVLWNDLDFEREYYMIDRKRSSGIPVAPAASLPFQQWSGLGADFVLAITAQTNGASMVVDVRMVSVHPGTEGHEAFAEEYSNCTTPAVRGCAHFIADDIHKQTRGLDGVARTQLAFSSDRDTVRVVGRPTQTEGASKEIYISDYDGANPQRVTSNHHLNLNPAWSPVGRALAFTSYVTGFPDIYVDDFTQPGKGLARPAHGTDRIQNHLAAWSPDGTRLAFMSNRSGNDDIWVVNRDGTGLQDLTNNPADDASPTWSPNGQQIAFISGRAGAQQLYVMSADGTGTRQLLEQTIDRPTWSPLGFIAFTIGSEITGWDIGVLDFNNPGPPTIITDGMGKNESPAVSPNGRHIAFTTTRWGKEQIAIVDRTGGTIRQITKDGNNDLPSWGPIPK